MPISFTEAETVAVGDKVTARNLRAMAAAFNSRFRTGIGDMAYRKAMYWFNLFRQVRNPDDSGLVFPAQGEFFEIYQHITPAHNIQWPVTGPGEAEGANVANPAMQYVFGLDGSVDSEEVRISEPNFPLWLGNSPPTTLEDIWTLGKSQRGAYVDDATQNVPAFEAAQQFFRVSTPYYSPHGKGYGGFFPTPVRLADDCGLLEEDGAGVASVAIKFTGLSADIDVPTHHGTDSTSAEGYPVVTYAGTCPEWTADVAAGHVQFILRMPFAYYVFVADGAGGIDVDRFATADWIEGPYVGAGVLSRYDGGHLSRALWAFISEFRGTASQRAADDYKIEDLAFDFQAFFTRQYYLAPARGTVSGAGIEASYPRFTLSASAAAQTLLTFQTGGTEYHFTTGYLLAGCYVKATGLSGEATLEVYSGQTLACLVTVTADAPEAMLWLEDPFTPQPLTVRIRDHVQLATGGSIIFESAELLDYKPEFWDAYLVLRLMATNGGGPEQSGVDGSGQDEADAPSLSTTYQTYGCIYNPTAAGVRTQADWVNDNPIFEAERKLSREHMRILARRQFVSYEVAGGKSILRFKRYAYGMNNSHVDCFEGIAPSYTPVSGDLTEGETYVVRGAGSIVYRGASYSAGQTFTATSVKPFQAHNGAELYIYDGIRHEALKKGFSNEWLMFTQTHVYHWSDTSLWKPDAYADYYTWNSRCHFRSGQSTADLKRHINYQTPVELVDTGSGHLPQRLPDAVQTQFVSPEAPSGYNYALGTNQVNILYNSYDFYKSCQIYQAPYEIESAIIEFDGPEEIVKLTFTGRFQYEATAPATVDPDPLNWSAGEKTALIAEAYRTDDNAFREYALMLSGGTQCTFKEGDAGTFSTVESDPDNPWGSCFPHCIFTKLIAFPYEDSNETQEPHDTRAVIDQLQHCEVALKACCEGFIDGVTSMAITCDNYDADPIQRLYDYTAENLYFEAFSGRSIGAFDLETRDASNAGFGPLPNTVMYAEVFNRIVNSVNLLTRARVMLPFGIQCIDDTYEGQVSIGGFWTPGASCSTLDPSSWRVAHKGAPPDAGTKLTANTWTNCGMSVGSSASSGIVNDCDGTSFILYTSKNVVQYKVSIDANAIEAIPEAWRDQLDSIGGFVARIITQKTKAVAESSSSLVDSGECCLAGIPPGDPTCPYFWDSTSSTGFKNITEETTVDTVECVLLTPGTLDIGAPPAGLFVAGHRGGSPPAFCNNQSTALIQVNLLSSDEFFIDVPTVEYAE